jgi:signal transduction histidine kinase
MNTGDRWAAAGLGTALFTAVAVEAVALAQTWGARYWLVGGTAAVLVSLLALLRHRHPMGTAIAGLTVAAATIATARVAGLPAEPSPALALGLAVLVGAAIRALPSVPAGAIGAAGLAVVAGSQFPARPFASGSAVATMAAGAAWLTAVAVGLSLRMLDNRARATAERVRHEERLDLARELHDVVAHHITGMLLQAQAARLVAAKRPGTVVESLVGIESAGADALAAMRRVVGLLRDTDDAAPAAPGPERLGTLLARFEGQGPAVHARVPDDTSGWPAEVTSTVYRVVQEALTNISRHAAQATSVSVTVTEEPEGVVVEVVDDAPPGAGRHRGGYGLIGMRERVAALGGTLRVGPRPGAGWSVSATLPVAAREPR